MSSTGESSVLCSGQSADFLVLTQANSSAVLLGVVVFIMNTVFSFNFPSAVSRVAFVHGFPFLFRS